MSTIEINKDLFPRVKLNRVSITTVYPGAAADDIELNVTTKIETALKSGHFQKPFKSANILTILFFTQVS